MPAKDSSQGSGVADYGSNDGQRSVSPDLISYVDGWALIPSLLGV
jgi:hypothetical protein